MTFTIKSKDSRVVIRLADYAYFSVVAVINDLEEQMPYDKSYDTSSSLVYSAKFLCDLILRYKNNQPQAQCYRKTIELGWRRGVYLNIDVDLTLQVEEYIDALHLIVLYAVNIYKPERWLSDEEVKVVKEVMGRADNFYIGPG